MFNMSRVLLLAGMRLGIPQALQMMSPSANILPPPTRIGRFNSAPPKRSYHRNRTTQHATNGERECARRRRQIAEGRLKRENGLEA